MDGGEWSTLARERWTVTDVGRESGGSGGSGGEPALKLVGVVVRVGRVLRVGPVDLAVGAGERLALVGPSGAGKTSLLRAVVGLDPLESGRVVVRGADVTARPPWGRGIGLAGQDAPHHPGRSVRANLELALRATGLDRAARRARAEAVASAVGLDALLDRSASVLSGGELRRLAVGRALAPRPAVLLLDEPYAHLDAPVAAQVAAAIDVAVAEDVAVVLVTHDARQVVAGADRIAFLDRADGAAEIVQAGPVDEVIAAPANRTVGAYLAPPPAGRRS